WRRRRYWLVASLARRCSTCTFPLDFNEWCGLLTIPIPTLRRGARRTSTDGLWSVVIGPGNRAPSNLATPLLTRAVEHGREPAPAAEAVPRQGSHDQGEAAQYEQLRPRQGPHRD